MKTRAQRQKDQAAGAPPSPAHELPATRPRRAAKSRNVRNSPARTAIIRNATRQTIERESLGESATTTNPARDETSDVQGSEAAGSDTVLGEADGQTGDHPHSERDQSFSSPASHTILESCPSPSAAQVSSPISPYSRVVPDDEILGQGIYAPASSPLSSSPAQLSSPLSSPPSNISTPPQAAEVAAATPAPAFTPATPSRASTLQLGHSTVTVSSCSWNTTPTPERLSSGASTPQDDDRSPCTRAWEATPVAKLSVGQERMLRDYGKRFPSEPYAILHFWESPTLQDLESARPVSVPTVAMAIPRSRIGELMNDLAAKYPGLVVQRTNTNVAVQTDGSTVAAKRRSPFDTENPRPARRVRFANDETPSNRRIIGYNPAPLYDSKGKLRLGPRFVPVYGNSSDEEDTDTDKESQAEDSESGGDESPAGQASMGGALQPASEPVQQPEPVQQQETTSYQVTETPRRWGIGKILDSASKYVPGLGRRARSTTTTLQSTPQNPQPQQSLATEPRLNTQPVITPTPKAPATVEPSRPARRTSKTQPETNKVTKPKRKTVRATKRMSRRNKHIQEEIDADEERARNSQAERDFIADQIRILHEEELEQKARADKKSESRSKRKRAPSPDVIPNPPGCSYGFDPKYFVVSDSESDESEPPSPTPGRPSKSRRIHRPPPPDPLVGSKENAQPYTGAIFSSNTPTYHGGNAFREFVTQQKTSAEKAAALKRSAAATPKNKELRLADGTPITNLSGHFAVPDDSDSETDESELSSSPSARKTEASSRDASTPKHPTSATFAESSRLVTPATALGKPTEQPAASSSPTTSNTPLKSKAQTWTQAPPPPPNPSHASLPPSASTDSDSLKAARAKALQHAPRKPSGLRESSRITSSPVAPGEDAIEAPKAFTIMQPSVDKQGTAPSASDEAIAQIQHDVANSPTPPLHEVLGILTEKAPNGQTKVSSAIKYKSNSSNTNSS